MKQAFNYKNLILLVLLFLLCIGFLWARKTNVLVQDRIPNNEDYIKVSSYDEVEIKIKSRVNDLSSLMLVTNNSEVKKGCFNLHIEDSYNKTIYANKLEDVPLFDHNYFELNFDDIKNSNNEEYTIFIEGTKKNSKKCKLGLNKAINEEEIITVKRNDVITDDIGIVQAGSGYNEILKNVIEILLLLTFFLLIYINFGNAKILKDKLLKHNIVFAAELALSISGAISFIKYKTNPMYYGSNGYFWKCLFVVSVLGIISMIALYLLDKDLAKEKLFLLLAIPIGISMLICILPFHKPDEIYHYKSAYQLATMQEFSKKIEYPNLNIYYSNYKDQLENINTVGYDDIKKDTRGKYNCLLYVVPAIGIIIGKVLCFSPLIGYYIGALLNFILFLVVGYYAIRRIPIGKFLLVVYMLNPIVLQQSASMSADCIINIVSIFFISYILYLAYEKKKIDNKDFVILVVSSCFIIIGKYAYFPLLALFLLVKKPIYKYIKQNKVKSLFYIIILLFILFGWIALSKKLSIVHSINSFGPQKVETKVGNLIAHPLTYIPIYLNTLVTYTPYYVESMLGKCLGLLDVLVSNITFCIYTVVLLLSLFIKDKEDIKLSKQNKVLYIIVSIIVFNIILLGLYVGWGTIDDVLIQGVQGRYFIPIFILLLLTLINDDNSIKSKGIENILRVTMLLNSVSVVLTIFAFFR